ncbi:enoyl-CoA hydratase/isomerase family protein [Streptomyces sp. NPDC089799]|uniref:enoyl-CoA hydratase/isomerase family protein n=1 Tax=Streptomyces sp. NPDC089799 TaxID=3155066 RepID=UPI00342BFB6F
MTVTGDSGVRTVREGRTGRIVLDRPAALNALTHTMVLRMTEALDAWEHDPEVVQVLVSGAGGRGLCAGGDVRAFHRDALTGGTGSVDFWRDEYRLNARIAHYPKPYVVLMDGIVMGGGVGVSAHGNVRIVTERSRVAMPETGIGFVPDVGGTWLLGRAPGELGTHMALTGTAVGAADALLCGLADHFVPSARLPELVAGLGRGTADGLGRRYAGTAPAGELAAAREWIDPCYSAGTVEEIVERLLAHGAPAAKEAAESILAKSPTALKVTLAALRRARTLGTLEEALEREFAVSCAALRGLPDMVEGIRAQVIDKDRNPRWSPATLQEVDGATVAALLTPGSGSTADGPGHERVFPRT